jgi:hypothetical protein
MKHWSSWGRSILREGDIVFRLGDARALWGIFPLTALAIPYGTGLVLNRPITLEQPVYLPGNEHRGVWASPLLETVFGPKKKPDREAAFSHDSRLGLRGDLELAVFAAGELRRSYEELPARLICDLIQVPRVRELLTDRGPAKP